MNLPDEKLFAVLARAAERRVSKFNAQDIANIAWAFATLDYLDEKSFTALASEAQLRTIEFKAQELANVA